MILSSHDRHDNHVEKKAGNDDQDVDDGGPLAVTDTLETDDVSRKTLIN